ncbi:MAG: hypothetical protein J6T54_06185, partial [Fibrobacter sp.]|nr:hypothetical protein [Fibrobacter sp.]
SVAIVNANHAAFFVQFVEHNASLKCMSPLPRRSQPTRTGASKGTAALVKQKMCLNGEFERKLPFWSENKVLWRFK